MAAWLLLASWRCKRAYFGYGYGCCVGWFIQTNAGFPYKGGLAAMTVVLEELIVDLARNADTLREAPERAGIDRRIIDHFDLSDIKRRRTYLMCLGEEVSDVTVSLAIMNMPGRDNALIGDLLTLKAHVERYGLYPFPVVCHGSWVSLQSRIYYPCLKTDASGHRAIVELVAGTGHWPADTRFLVIDKPV